MPAKVSIQLLSLAFSALPLSALAEEPPFVQQKTRVLHSVRSEQSSLTELANQIWALAETALREDRSAELLAGYLEGHGFDVHRGVAGMPTAFVAEYGEGSPVIGLLGEYDALPGLSQRASPEKEPLHPGAAGHGCVHNLFGAAAAGAAVALSQFMESDRIPGTIRYFGTPAEEAVGGKVFMIKAGLFDDVDVALAWHPSTSNEADAQSSQAIVDFKVSFTGRTSHAAFDPWNGRSALDGVEMFTHALNLMREHIRPTVRIHYVIERGGLVPNVVPEEASVWCWIRDSTRGGVDAVLQRARKAAEGAALATETQVEVRIEGGDYEVLPIRSGARRMHRNMLWIGPSVYDQSEIEFAHSLQRNLNIPEKGIDGSIAEWRETSQHPEGGSTDVGDVSWVVPVINMTATTAPVNVPWHGWGVVASAGMSIGHKGMMLAAKALGATGIDLLLDSDLRTEVAREFEAKTNGHVYRPFVRADSPTLPK